MILLYWRNINYQYKNITPIITIYNQFVKTIKPECPQPLQKGTDSKIQGFGVLRSLFRQTPSVHEVGEQKNP